MEPRPHYFIVGVFVLAMAALGIILVLWFSKIDFLTKENYYAIYFDGAVTGLRENEEVKFRGIPIGKVYKITVDKVNVDKVRVLVNISRPELIHEDSVATIEAQGLTGYTFVQIRGSTKNSPILRIKPGDKFPIIKSKPSEIESLFAETPRILENLNQVLKKFSTFLDEDTVKNLQVTIQNLKQMSQDLSQGPHSLKVAIGDMRSSFKQVEKAADDFSKFSKQLDHIVGENRQAIHEFSGQGLPKLTRFFEKAQKTIESVGHVAEDLEKGPAQFLQKNTTGGYKIE